MPSAQAGAPCGCLFRLQSLPADGISQAMKDIFCEKRDIAARLEPVLWELLEKCVLCPRRCGVNRLAGEKGFCALAGEHVPIASYCVHRGEEPAISGHNGSGTIFFGHCNLGCIYCQNQSISDNSIPMDKNMASVAELSGIMLSLQQAGCHNINLVTPTHVLPYIVSALKIAFERGLSIPVVYNCGGYERAGIIKMLDGLVDIYLPDFKYMDSGLASLCSHAPDYPETAAAAFKEMYRQTGPDLILKNGTEIARRGLIVRHLVLPGNVENSIMVLEWMAKELSNKVHLSLMSQYYPAQERGKLPPQLNRTLLHSEYETVAAKAVELGFENGWFQEPDSHKTYRPDFKKKHPFEG